MNYGFPISEILSGSGRNKVQYLLGNKIKRLLRKTPGSFERTLNYYREHYPNIKDEDRFSFIEGSLHIILHTGVEFSFFIDESWQSLAYVYLKNEYGNLLIDPKYEYCFYSEETILDVIDSKYSNQIMASYLDKTIIDIRIFKNKADVERAPLPDNYHGDCAISFVFEDGGELVLGLHLVPNMPIMSVTPWSSLDQEIIDNLYEYPINWNEEWVEPTDEDVVCV